MIEEIKRLAKEYSKEIISLRREMHRNPELSFREINTSKLIFRKLNSLNLDKVERIAKTGVTGLILKKNSRGKCVALRSDI